MTQKMYLCDPENVLKIDQIQQMLESVLNAVNMQLALMSLWLKFIAEKTTDQVQVTD
jgi:hypothetical protein